MQKTINIIGGGLAGCEAAWQAAKRGIQVNLYEMRQGDATTFAHKTDQLAELVCSNSFRNDDPSSAIGLLHHEMRSLDSLIMAAADANRVPAGSALAMDRELFAKHVTNKISQHPNIKLIRQEITSIPNDGAKWIIATGPLTSDALSQAIIKLTGEDKLAFFDAIAPIIYKDSIDFNIAWFQSRYDKTGPAGTGKDYINCPLNKEQYLHFIDSLLAAPVTEFKEWEKDTPYFNGCLPIEVMAERGIDTLRFGPMKPVGLTNPHKLERPYAVVQLRQDNLLGSLYNMVGFQTKLKYANQAEIFKLIPGLENAVFARMGGLHRNSFIKSPLLLNERLQLRSQPHLQFAGQITGVEGYVESAAMGLIASIFSSMELLQKTIDAPPATTAIGGLINHLTINANAENFQPMNINFGLIPALSSKVKAKKDRYTQLSKRAQIDLQNWLTKNQL